MRWLLTTLSCAAVTLWLGGLVALFIFVQVMFKTDRATAVSAAPMLFRAFEMYQLILLIVGVLAIVGWQWVGFAKAKRWILLLVLTAGALAIVQTAVVSARMNALTAGGQNSADQFRRLHGYSMTIYSTQTLLLMAAAVLLPTAIRHERLRTLPQTVPA